MIDRAIKLFGTDEPVPEQRRLVAGPVTATLEGGQLRWIKVGDTEVIRAIVFLIRDRIWSTCPPKISNLRIDEGGGGFVVTFDALTRTADGDLPWHAEFRGTPDGTIRCEAVARPEQDFLTCRTGFVILHPLAGVAGRAMEIEHVDGTVERTEAPQLIDPAQPFLDVRAMTHEPLPGVRATLRMEGDTWETEDHRNWSDASFKTYSRPLVLPWPYTVPGGTEIRHTVTLSFAGRLPDAPASEGGSVTVTLGRETGPMPRLGLSVLPEDAELALSVADLVKQAGPQHLNCRIDLRDAGWQDALPRYRELAQRVGAEVVLEIIIPGAERAAAEVERAAAAVQAADLRPAAVVVTPAADLKSYPPGTPLPEGVPSWQEIIGATRAAFPRARIGGGMLSNFTELNRKRPPAELLDFVTHATSTLIHACDDRTVMENLETIGHIIRSTQAFSGDTAYRIGPAHIGNSFNPYGADYTSNPDNRRITMARIDPRHRALFGAAWHLGYFSEVARGGLEAATMASPAGEFGIAYARLPHAQSGLDDTVGAKVYPVFHVIRGLAAAAGARRIEADSSDPGRLRALAWRDNGRTQLWLANLHEAPLEVELGGAPAGTARLWLLDEDSFEAAIEDPAVGARSAPFTAGDRLTLRPFAVARLSFGE
jgi:D-apionolactonase